MNLLIQMQGGRGVEDAILNLMNLCSLTVFCLLTASMSLFMDKCFQKGMIFRKYYNLIAYWFWLPSKKTVFVSYPPKTLVNKIIRETIEGLRKSKHDSDRHYADPFWTPRPIFTENRFQWLFKILGGCIYCFSTWIFIGLYLLIVSDIQHLRLSLIGLILGIGLNYFWIEVLLKIKK
jgi:hypothetical protein